MTNYFIWWPYKRRQTLVRNWCCRTLWSMLNRSHKHWLSVNTTSIALTWIRLKRLHRLYKYWRKIQYVIDTLVESCHAVSDTRSCYNVAKLVTSTVIAERKQDQKKTKARESLGRVMEISGHCCIQLWWSERWWLDSCHGIQTVIWSVMCLLWPISQAVQSLKQVYSHMAPNCMLLSVKELSCTPVMASVLRSVVISLLSP